MYVTTECVKIKVNMFGRNEIDFSLIQTTSKDALKRSALMAANYDIKKATEIYDFYMKDMEDLPAFDPAPPTTMDQINSFADMVSAWTEKHPDITNGISNIVMNMIKSRLGTFAQPTSAAEVPPPVG